jgi:hypothetical protein
MPAPFLIVLLVCCPLVVGGCLAVGASKGCFRHLERIDDPERLHNLENTPHRNDDAIETRDLESAPKGPHKKSQAGIVPAPVKGSFKNAYVNIKGVGGGFVQHSWPGASVRSAQDNITTNGDFEHQTVFAGIAHAWNTSNSRPNVLHTPPIDTPAPQPTYDSSTRGRWNSSQNPEDLWARIENRQTLIPRRDRKESLSTVTDSPIKKPAKVFQNVHVNAAEESRSSQSAMILVGLESSRMSADDKPAKTNNGRGMASGPRRQSVDERKRAFEEAKRRQEDKGRELRQRDEQAIESEEELEAESRNFLDNSNRADEDMESSKRDDIANIPARNDNGKANPNEHLPSSDRDTTEPTQRAQGRSTISKQRIPKNRISDSSIFTHPSTDSSETGSALPSPSNSHINSSSKHCSSLIKLNITATSANNGSGARHMSFDNEQQRLDFNKSLSPPTSLTYPYVDNFDADNSKRTSRGSTSTSYNPLIRGSYGSNVDFDGNEVELNLVQYTHEALRDSFGSDFDAENIVRGLQRSSTASNVESEASYDSRTSQRGGNEMLPRQSSMRSEHEFPSRHSSIGSKRSEVATALRGSSGSFANTFEDVQPLVPEIPRKSSKRGLIVRTSSEQIRPVNLLRISLENPRQLKAQQEPRLEPLEETMAHRVEQMGSGRSEELQWSGSGSSKRSIRTHRDSCEEETQRGGGRKASFVTYEEISLD